MNILGIDTSCDDTAAAVVRDGRLILASIIRSQLRTHAQYGGVVPEVASRAHLGDIASVVEEALTAAGLGLADLDAIGVTRGPGLSGALMVGVSFAKGLAMARDLPLLPVNHLEGHIYSNWLIPQGTDDQPEPRFPVLVLIVSGGHTELLLMREHCRYERLGGTRDDAAGEAFDKVGRRLGLGFPGGPAIQRTAEGFAGDLPRLPRAWLRGTYDFSFSGLKTAVWQLLQEQGGLENADITGIAASFQDSVVDVLATKVLAAAQEFGAATVAICGGVAANAALRTRVMSDLLVPVYVPPLALCMDNGAMIAAAAYYRWQHPEEAADDADPLLAEVEPGLALEAKGYGAR
jgi:N6-L-threonylcarbamoyladenine synthase